MKNFFLLLALPAFLLFLSCDDGSGNNAGTTSGATPGDTTSILDDTTWRETYISWVGIYEFKTNHCGTFTSLAMGQTTEYPFTYTYDETILMGKITYDPPSTKQPDGFYINTANTILSLNNGGSVANEYEKQ